MYTYLLINLLSLAIPFAYSFTARSGFSRRFSRAWGGIVLVALPMIAWDAWFTARGIWSFNPDFHLGVKVFGLPFEEVLFFLCIPFACLFIYDTVKKFPRLALPERPVRVVAGFVGVGLFALAILNHERAYTFWCFLLASPFALALAAGAFRHRAGFIATTYLFHLIPFFLVNGLLTGLPVVLYNDAENLGIRLGTIPVEDAVYSLILLCGTIFWLERGNRRDAPPAQGRTQPVPSAEANLPDLPEAVRIDPLLRHPRSPLSLPHDFRRMDIHQHQHLHTVIAHTAIPSFTTTPAFSPPKQPRDPT